MLNGVQKNPNMFCSDVYHYFNRNQMYNYAQYDSFKLLDITLILKRNHLNFKIFVFLPLSDINKLYIFLRRTCSRSCIGKLCIAHDYNL